jgi:hypothetical protein
MERRPAVNKSSTVTMSGNQILKQKKLTIGMDLGDRSTRYCVLGEAGEVILERSVPTTKKGMDQAFAAMPRSRVALETGAHSPCEGWPRPTENGYASVVPSKCAQTWLGG